MSQNSRSCELIEALAEERSIAACVPGNADDVFELIRSNKRRSVALVAGSS